MSQFSMSNCYASDQILRYHLDSQENYVVGQPVNIVFTLENLSSAPLWVLTWYTPLEGLKGKIFRVICDSQEISYEGPMVKRGSPTQDDYVFIGAGQSVSAENNISLAYNLPSSKVCQVEFRGKIHDVVFNEAQLSNREERHQSMEILGNIVTFRLIQDSYPNP